MMEKIESVDRKYKEYLHALKSLHICKSALSDDLNSSKINSVQKFHNMMRHISDLSVSINYDDFPYLSDTTALANLFDNCMRLIENYRKELLKFSTDSSLDYLIIDAATDVKEAQHNFDVKKKEFCESYQTTINDADSMNNLLKNAIEQSISLTEEEIKGIKEYARDLLKCDDTIELHADSAVPSVTVLPRKIMIAQEASKPSRLSLLTDLGISAEYQNIYTDVQNHGNIIIKTADKNMFDEEIDEFVASYVMKYIESFPLGSVNVHIIDDNTSFLMKRLINSFHSGHASDTAQNIIRHWRYLNEAIEPLQNITCEDIIKKITRESPNLYSIYKTDQSDPFNLIVIRNGLTNANVFPNMQDLNAVFRLINERDTGHLCGLRFLIVDNSASFKKQLDSKVIQKLESIENSCHIKLQYSDGTFSLNGKPVKVLCTAGSTDEYIQSRSRILIRAISEKEKHSISVEDLSFEQTASVNDPVLRIPVGKTGTETIALPLSCKDDNGTVEGQCIGYMVIGQSGSGKSSFFHSIVLNGCLKYPPKELQFWLLDFKYGGASSKYSDSGLPHIKIIAENNKIDDAICLFQMVGDEMSRRNEAFKKAGTNDIIEYNKIALHSDTLEYFPRIIIIIDEVQELFRDENAAILQQQISTISVRMRSAGMHFIMVAQNLCDGKSYLLKEAFLPNVKGRICFRVEHNVVRDSGYITEFIEREQEIQELHTGEAYVSYGKSTIQKVKIAYASSEDMIQKYFPKIRAKYPEYSKMKPLVIGSKKRLSIAQTLQKSHKSYFELMRNLSPINGVYSLLLGEDAYRMEPFFIHLSQNENSAVIFSGNDKVIGSSLCASAACALVKQGAHVYLFNGDSSRIQSGYESYMHPFMYVCQATARHNIHNYKLSQFADVVKKLYIQYLTRQIQVQQSDCDSPEFQPEFLVVNDLFGIESFAANAAVTHGNDESSGWPVSARNQCPDTPEHFNSTVQGIITSLLQNGYRYNIHVILALKGELTTWRTSSIVSCIRNIILFNTTQFSGISGNSYVVKEMLSNITNNGDPETMAVSISNQTQYSKIRPLIFDMSVPQEQDILKQLCEGE